MFFRLFIFRDSLFKTIINLKLYLLRLQSGSCSKIAISILFSREQLCPLIKLGHPLFFRLLSNAFSDFGSVGRKKKKNAKIKLERSLELGGSVPQHNIRGA